MSNTVKELSEEERRKILNKSFRNFDYLDWVAFIMAMFVLIVTFLAILGMIVAANVWAWGYIF